MNVENPGNIQEKKINETLSCRKSAYVLPCTWCGLNWWHSDLNAGLYTSANYLPISIRASARSTLSNRGTRTLKEKSLSMFFLQLWISFLFIKSHQHGGWGSKQCIFLFFYSVAIAFLHFIYFAFNTCVCMFVCLLFGVSFNLCTCVAMSLVAYLSLFLFVFLSRFYGQFVLVSIFFPHKKITPPPLPMCNS